jgi:hypothetical protein
MMGLWDAEAHGDPSRGQCFVLALVVSWRPLEASQAVESGSSGKRRESIP